MTSAAQTKTTTEPESDADAPGERAEGDLHLRLYIASGAPNSAAAVDNLRRLLAESGRQDARLEIVDVFEEPRRTLEDGIRFTPTLVKLAPTPETRVVGNLSDTAAVMRALRLGAERR